MSTMLRRARGLRGDGGDRGVALIVSIALTGLVAMVVLALVAVAVSEARFSGRDRQRSVAVMTAEGTVDTAIAQIQSAAPSSLPCGTLGSAGQVLSDSLTTSTEVTYYDSFDAEVPCDQVATSSDLETASIKSTTTTDQISGTLPAVRTMETLLRLTPVYGNDLDKAIFGNAGVIVENNGKVVTADGVPTADVYTNGDFECDGNQEYQGSIHAQGDITLDNSCLVAVDAYAGGTIDGSHPQAVINGRALAAGGDSRVDGHLGQYARASGTASGAACTPASKCVSNVSVPLPPAETFPQISWPVVGSAWQSELGFTNVVTFPSSSCEAPSGGDKFDGAGKWIRDNASSLPGNTVLLVNCSTPVYMSGINLAFNYNFAVFASRGVKIDGNPVITSTSASSPRNLYLVQPYGNACTSDPGIYLGNNVTFTTSANVMLYSPCDIDKRNQSDITGQIYAGGVAQLSNKTAMTFKLLPMAGIDVTSSTIESYDVEILYKRENVG